jgi:hypothetical protein
VCTPGTGSQLRGGVRNLGFAGAREDANVAGGRGTESGGWQRARQIGQYPPVNWLDDHPGFQGSCRAQAVEGSQCCFDG